MSEDTPTDPFHPSTLSLLDAPAMTDVEKAADRSEDTISTLTTPLSGSPESPLDFSGPATEPQPKVDGGLKAWLTLAGTCASLYCAFGQKSAFGTFQTYYGQHQLQHLSASTISWIGSVQLWVFFFSVSRLRMYSATR